MAIDANRSDIWQQLAGHYERDQRPEDCARALEAELANRPEHGRELELRARLAELYLQLARPDRARRHYERVFDLSPSHPAAAQFLERAYEDERHFEDVVALLETRLAAIDAVDPHAASRRTALRLQIAHVRETHLDDLEGSISALEVALDELGPDAVVAEPLAAAYQRGDYHDDLIELCQKAAAASQDPAERANWWSRLGDAHLCIDQPSEAADAYRRALADRPGDRATSASLRELYRAQGRSEPLALLLEAELRHLAGTAEIPVRLELVERERATRPANALVHASRVLQLAPRHRGALEAAVELAGSLGRHEEALAILEGRIRASQSAREAAPFRAQKGAPARGSARAAGARDRELPRRARRRSEPTRGARSAARAQRAARAGAALERMARLRGEPGLGLRRRPSAVR